MKLLYRSSLRYLLRHPAQVLLAILGVALGVAVVIAIDLANGSAQRAFMLSTESVTGKTTDQILAGQNGLPSDLYAQLRTELGLSAVAPVVDRTISLPNRPGRSFRLFGIDPFAEQPFRPYLATLFNNQTDLQALLTEPNTGLISAQTAQTLALTVGQTLETRIDGQRRNITIIGLIAGSDQLSQEALADLILVDISTAQELVGQPDRISRIDLILPEEQRSAILEQIKPLLPADATLTTPAARSETLQQMTRAFELNLQALSLLALIVGVFLIYNTMTFSVVQRRGLFGILRSLGVTRRELFSQILIEAAVIGTIGAMLGVLLGIVLGRGLVRLVTQTINDLYFSVNVQNIAIDNIQLIKGFGLGLGATLIAASIPALEAMFSPPRTVLRRSSIEERIQRIVPRLTLAGLGLAGLGVALLQIPSRSLFLSFSAMFGVIIGCALFTPFVTLQMMRLLQMPLNRIFGLLGKMAARDVVAALSRTGVAIAALMVAVSVTVGAGTMIGSFRTTVVRWLDQSLQADVFVSAPGLSANRADTPIDLRLVEQIDQLPSVASMTTLLNLRVESELGPVQLTVANYQDSSLSRRALSFITDAERAWQGFAEQGQVWVSEPFSYRYGRGLGDSITLQTERGSQKFTIAGVYYDYASDQGYISMNRRDFAKYWDVDTVHSITIWLAENADSATTISQIQALAAPIQDLKVQSNQALRQSTLEIFDRTFAITAVLQLLATIVAFIGILSALMALQLERSRELGVLRANGMTPRQLWLSVLSQTGLMGLTAGLLALPVGLILAVVLVYVINKRSFGWTMQLILDPNLLLQALIVAVVAALLAGLYPAWKMGRTSPALALREE